MKICIVTGASSGMGREFVLQLDQKHDYDEIWVIARREDRLRELKGQTRARIHAMALDLQMLEGMSLLQRYLETYKPEVVTLVNAAGFGRFGAFRDMDITEQLDMIDLNVKALTQVTYMVLPYMSSGSEIYNLGSLSSFQPVPYIGVYGAGKAYVLSFSRMLNVELEKDGIRVMAVCPGWVRTEFFDRAATDDTITYYNCYATAEEVVERAIRDMERGRDVSTAKARVRGLVLLTKLLSHRLVMKIWCKQQGK